ncbi:nicotinate-nucleotide--dimethylbenzimidazole phosphoribosyltransferase [archaeon]|nr:nicotinate-nucleotide--dimethylbenzimidazole phosphoribosyltransferase [archaeon]
MELLKDTIKRIKPVDSEAMEKARERQDDLTKPRGSLGKLEEISIKLAGIQGNAIPEIKNKVIFTFAGDHGIVEEGISAYPSEVTKQMVLNFLNGGAAINVLARHVNARVVVADLGVSGDIEAPELIVKKVGYGTKNFAREPAMTRAQAVEAIEAGIEIFNKQFRGAELIALGDMGIGNTTSSSAICSAITGRAPEEVTGRGTGIGEEAYRKKVTIIRKALELHKPEGKDAIDVLNKVGGFEIAGLAGVTLAAASNRVAVVSDGFISTTGALIAHTLNPDVSDYIFAAHRSVEKGHEIILEHMKLEPVLDLNLRLGEGTGAALAISIIEAGVKILREMATFSGAGVSKTVE